MNETKRKRWSLWPVCMVLAISGGAALADDGEGKTKEAIQVADHHIFGSNVAVDGATLLIRDYKNREVRASVMTGALEPDFAYSIWWVVFNNPQYCATPYACTGGDLEINGGDPHIKASVFYGGGMLADGTGHATTELTLVPGRTTRELFAMSKDYGLRNLRKAEIHLVIRSHGLAGIAGPVSMQIGTANQACPDAGCANVFASVHPSAN